VEEVLPTNNIRTPTAKRTVVDNLGQMPPATTAFVVGGFGDDHRICSGSDVER
jgi:hypothetical protein